jgi:hypothetical protein
MSEDVGPGRGTPESLDVGEAQHERGPDDREPEPNEQPSGEAMTPQQGIRDDLCADVGPEFERMHLMQEDEVVGHYGSSDQENRRYSQ